MMAGHASTMTTDPIFTKEDHDNAREACERAIVKHLGGSFAEDAALLAAYLTRTGWTKPDPLVVEAREICTNGCGTEYTANRYRSGEYDKSRYMQLALLALRRGIELAGEGK